MPLPIVRYKYKNQIRWGLSQVNVIKPLDIFCNTTAELIELGFEHIREAGARTKESLDASQIELLSPITKDAKVLCQGANYRQHMLDSGLDPDSKSYNMFFTKSSASITDPVGRIIRPPHVKLLDYEVELTLVIRKATHRSITVNDKNLHEFLAGICIGNDISARDVQLPQMQFHKGKSYRTFCPLGPVLCLLDKEDMNQLDNLKLTLSVNGDVRQQDQTANMVFKPAETLTEFSEIVDFNPGDVVMTGTPAGCAFGMPSPFLVKMATLLPEEKKWQLFHKKQLARPQYLQSGDKVESTIKSKDGSIDLGKQSHIIVEGETR